MRAKLSLPSLAALILITASAALADEVSLSRYVVKHDIFDEGSAVTALDTDLLRRFCGDDDGCLVIVRSRGVGDVSSVHVFLGVANLWTTTDAASFNVDNNSILDWELGGNAESDGLLCTFTDFDEVTPSKPVDNAVGFSLFSTLLSYSAPGTCTLVVSD